jgi:mono/diheme cytochrome c family protein
MKLTVTNLKKIVITGIAAVGIATAALSSGVQTRGAALDGSVDDTYKAKCAACHGADGTGNTPAGKSLKVKDMHSAEVQDLSDEDLLKIISAGKGKMPGYEKSLGADTCKQLLQKVRSFK